MVNQLASEAATDPRFGLGGNKPPRVHELFTSELTETYAQEFAKVEPIAERANNAPERIESDDHLKVWTNIYLDADTLFKSLDEARLNEQRPMLAALKAVFGPTLDRLTRITAHGRKLGDDYNREKVRKERMAHEAEAARLRAESEAKRREAEVAAEFGDVDQTVAAAQEAAQIATQVAQAVAETPKAADVARVRTDDGGMSTAKGEWKFEIADYSKVDLNAIRSFFAPADIDKAVRKVVKIQKGATRIEGVRVFEDVATQFRR